MSHARSRGATCGRDRHTRYWRAVTARVPNQSRRRVLGRHRDASLVEHGFGRSAGDVSRCGDGFEQRRAYFFFSKPGSAGSYLISITVIDLVNALFCENTTTPRPL